MVAGEVTQAVRDSSCDARADRRGRLAGHRPRRHPRRRRRPRRGGDRAARRSSSPTTTRSSPSSRVRARRPPSPATSRSGSPSIGPTSRPRSTTAASRCTRTSSASSSPADGPAPLRELAEPAGHRAEGRRPRPSASRRSPRSGVDTVLDLLTYYPRRYLDRTNAGPLADLEPARRRRSLVDGRCARPVAGRRNRQDAGRRRRDRRDRRTSGSPSSTSRGGSGSCRRGTEVVVFGKVDDVPGRRQMTNPVVDLVGDKTGRIVPVYPQSEKAGLIDLATSPGGSTRCCGGARDFADPLPAAVLGALRPGRPDRGASATSTRPSRWRDVADGPHAAWCSTSCCGSSSRWCGASGSSSATAVGHRARHRSGSGRHLVDRFHERLAVRRSPARSSGRSTRSPATWPSAHPMHRLLQGDVGCRQDGGRRRRRCSSAVQGGHQGALMAPTEVLAEQHFTRRPGPARRLHRARHRRGNLFAGAGSTARPGRAAHQPDDGGRAPPAPRRPGGRRRRPRHRHPRPHPGGRRASARSGWS